jgi:hypothetical protein
MRRAALTSLCTFVLAAGACTSSRTDLSALPTLPAARRATTSPTNPPRWVVPSRVSWVERSEAGVDRMIVGARRVEARGADVIGAVKGKEDIDGAAAAPRWMSAEGSPARYVLWKERDLYSAAEPLGARRGAPARHAPRDRDRGV